VLVLFVTARLLARQRTGGAGLLTRLVRIFTTTQQGGT